MTTEIRKTQAVSLLIFLYISRGNVTGVSQLFHPTADGETGAVRAVSGQLPVGEHPEQGGDPL